MMIKKAIASAALIMFLAAVTPIIAGETKNLALCIGVHEYDNYPSVPSADDDAIAVGRLLESSGAFRRVIVMTSRDGDGATRVDTLVPHKSNISRVLTLMAANTPSEGNLVVYYNGRAVSRDGSTYLLPADASSDGEDAGIPLLELTTAMASSRAVGKTLILDACHGGGFTPSETELAVAGDNFTIITACAGGESALAGGVVNRGMFALALEKAFSGRGDDDEDGVIDAGEILSFAELFIGDYCLNNLILEQQTPRLWGNEETVVLEGYAEVDETESVNETVAETEPTPTETLYVDPAPTQYSSTTYPQYQQPQTQSYNQQYYHQPQQQQQQRQRSQNQGAQKFGRTLRKLVLGF